MIGVHSVATCEAVFEATRDWVFQWCHDDENFDENDDGGGNDDRCDDDDD